MEQEDGTAENRQRLPGEGAEIRAADRGVEENGRYDNISQSVLDILEEKGVREALEKATAEQLEEIGLWNDLKRSEQRESGGTLSDSELTRKLTDEYAAKEFFQGERGIQRIAQQDPELAMEIENAFLEIAERTQDPRQRAELLKTAGSYDSIIQDVTDAKKGNPVRKRLWKNESLLLTAENPEIEAQIAQKLLDSEQISRYNEKQKRLSEGELFEDVFSGETKVVWPEKAHKNWTEGHWETIQAGVKILLQTGDYSVIYVNRGLSNEVPGIRPNRRPDIMAVRKDGTIEQFEVMSKSDKFGELEGRVTGTKSRLGERGGRYEIIDIPEEWKGSTW